MRALLLAFTLACGLAEHAFAWGPEGHVIVAMVAEDRLSSSVRAKVRKILAGAPLATAALFADEYRVTHPETARWHFVDIPFDASGYDEARDCSVEVAGDCIIHAIERAKALVKNPKTEFYARADALKYLVHFVGDLHQPFHAVEGKLANGEGDQGGNKIKVKFFGEEDNLHSVWDTGLILHTGLTAEDYAKHLDTDTLAAMTDADWQNGTPVDWAIESHAATKSAYVSEHAVLDQAYFDAQIVVVDKQLARAGARLAMILEELLQ
jgi:hypothetical protein